MKKLLGTAAILLLALASLNSPVFAQAADGNVVGQVLDSSGAAIAGVAIEATNVDTGVKYTAKSGADGSYRLNNLPTGKYDISASYSGFATSTLKSFTAELNRTTTANVTLKLAAQASTVEVVEAGAAIDTTTSQITSTYETRQTTDLSLGASAGTGYGALNLSLLSAGVASSGGIGYGAGPSVGGQRPTNNNFVIEGIDNNRIDVTGPITYISNEATAEFTVMQNMMSPEFGHSSGGTFNTVIKSGTNEVHGSLYEYLQNRNLNALDAAVKRAGISERQRFDSNRLGATIGGPAIKNKLFYFGNFEYQPLGEAGTPSSEVLTPTAAGYTALGSIASISKTNLGVLSTYAPPSPRQTDTTLVAGVNIPIGTLPIVSPSFSNTYSYLGGLDYDASPQDRLRFRFIANNTRAIDTTPTLAAFFSSQPTNAYNVSLRYFRNFTPGLSNEASFGYTRFFQSVPVGSFAFPGLSVFPNISIDNDLNLQLGPDPNGPQFTIINTYSLIDNLTWIKGKNTVKMGYSGRRVVAPQSFIQRSRGDYNYSNLERFLLDKTPDDLAERSFGVSDFWGNLWSHDLFINDDYKLRPNLTINLGLRWEYVGIPAANATQALNSISSVPGLIEFRTPTAQKGNFAPRVGMAWSPGKNGTMSVRAGMGILYDQVYQNLGILSLPPQATTTVDSEVDFTKDPSGYLAKGGILNPAGVGALSAADARALTGSFVPDQVRPYSINWTLGVQKVFASNYTLEVRYVGTRGVHLPMQIRLNRGTVVTPSHSLPTYMARPAQTALDALPLNLAGLQKEIDPVRAAYLNAGFQSNIVGFMPVGNSSYNGLATELNRRMSHGLQTKIAYTWSHAIDDGTAAVFSTVIAPRRAQDFTNLRSERSTSALDRRHRFTVSWIYDVQWMKGSHNWAAKNLIGNWTYTGTYMFESPQFGVVQSGVDSNLNGDTAGDRAIVNSSGDMKVGSGVTALKNTKGDTVAYVANNPNAGYIVAGAGAYANGGRMTLPLRGIQNFDMTFAKNFNFTEKKRIQFRADFYNAFNHSQFTPGSINTVAPTSRTDTRNYLIPSTSSFNNPETAFGNNPRVIQLAMKFIF
jgi:hypothetical protein